MQNIDITHLLSPICLCKYAICITGVQLAPTNNERGRMPQMCPPDRKSGPRRCMWPPSDRAARRQTKSTSLGTLSNHVNDILSHCNESSRELSYVHRNIRCWKSYVSLYVSLFFFVIMLTLCLGRSTTGSVWIRHLWREQQEYIKEEKHEKEGRRTLGDSPLGLRTSKRRRTRKAARVLWQTNTNIRKNTPIIETFHRLFIRWRSRGAGQASP